MDETIAAIEATLDLPKSRCRDHPDVLRFSVCDLGNGRTGYQWASIKTHSIATMQCLRIMWDNRREIAAVLKGNRDG